MMSKKYHHLRVWTLDFLKMMEKVKLMVLIYPFLIHVHFSITSGFC